MTEVYMKNDFTGENYNFKITGEISYSILKQKAIELFRVEDVHIAMLDEFNHLSAISYCYNEIQIKPKYCFYVAPTSTEYGTCAICLDPMIGGNIRTTHCGHSFHSTCLRNISRCPMCRGNIGERLA